MSIRQRKWKDKNGNVMEAWSIDIKIQLPGQGLVRVRKSSPINTKRGAQQYEHQVRQALLDGTFSKHEAEEARPVVETLADFAPRFIEMSVVNNKPSSVEAKRTLLRLYVVPILGTKKLDAVGAEDIERLKATMLKAGKGAKTVNNALMVLRRMLAVAVEWGVIAHAPKVRAIKVGQSPYDFLDFEEAERLIKKADDTWRLMVTTALGTGLRIGELLALKWEDIDLTRSMLVVRRSLWRDIEGPPKSNRIRHIPIGPTLRAQLTAHRHLRGPYVFCLNDGGRLSHSNVKDVVPRMCRLAGLSKRVTWHDLRHTFASHLVMKGAPIKAVQELLGHATLEMTLRYAHLTPDIRRDAILLLEPLSSLQPRGTTGAHDA